MSTAKDRVYNLILESGEKGLETQEIAEQLKIQRPNASSLLNQLVSEGKIAKTKTRPVRYCTLNTQPTTAEDSCFKAMIGFDGSLQKAVQLAKAAILYPQKSLHTIIVAPQGCGTSCLVSLMNQFARDMNVIAKDAPFIKLDCSHYAEHTRDIHHELFGASSETFHNCFEEAQNGILFIDRVDEMDGLDQSALIRFIETGKVLYDRDEENQERTPKVMLILFCIDSANEQILESFTSRIVIQITLPSLNSRPLEERLELVNRFLSIESARAKRQLEVSDEIIRSLILYDANLNVKQLNQDIKVACATAYVRNYADPKKPIQLYLSDFPGYVQKGMLNYKKHQRETDRLVNGTSTYVFDSETTFKKYTNFRPIGDVYLNIQQRIDELKNQGIEKEDITKIVNTYVDTQFRRYAYSLSSQVIDTEQLSKLVDSSLITIVKNFLHDCEERFQTHYPASVCYGLCLHINSLLNGKHNPPNVSKEQITNIVQNFNQEYSSCLALSFLLKTEYSLDLSIEDVVIMTMFLTNVQEEETVGHPQLLLCMHGDSTARSLKSVIQDLCKTENVYAFDMPLSLDTTEALEQLKALVLQMDQGKGIIAIYDMGSFKTMLESIQEDTGIVIRMLFIPLTLIGVDSARKCAMEEDVDSVYHSVVTELIQIRNEGEEKPSVFVTLCNTGEGGARELSEYIRKNSKMGFQTIPLAISDRRALIKEVTRIRRENRIEAFVGTYDPKLFGIPFIPIQNVFSVSPDQLDSVLLRQMDSKEEDVVNKMFVQLDQDLEHVPKGELKKELPPLIEKMNEDYGLNLDQRIGLCMHIACMIDHLLAHLPSPHNAKTDEIRKQHPEEFKEVTKDLKKTEKKFGVIIPDDEIANILEIIGL